MKSTKRGDIKFLFYMSPEVKQKIEERAEQHGRSKTKQLEFDLREFYKL